MIEHKGVSKDRKKDAWKCKSWVSVMFQYWTFTHRLDIIQIGSGFIKIAQRYGKSINVCSVGIDHPPHINTNPNDPESSVKETFPKPGLYDIY